MRTLPLIFLIIIACILTPRPVHAAESLTLDIANGPVSISSGSYTQNGQSRNHSGSYVLTGASETNNVVIQDGEHFITISDLSIDLSRGMDSIGTITIMEGAAISLLIEGDNTLYSSGVRAGIEVPEKASLTIVEGSFGTLTARGGMNSETGGAGIGGAAGFSSGTIIIEGGIITTTGGRFSAGIGGGDGIYGMDLDPGIEPDPEELVGVSGNGGEIIITGGYITANGGYKAAGIGGGYAGNGGDITISGGNVVSTSETSGAGIGGGYAGNGGNITITGGLIDAVSEFAGAGIGGGEYGKGGTIDISGGEVTASSHVYGAGIGGGQNADSGDITITGGVISATNYLYASGIGGGANGGAGLITIKGGTINANGGSYGAGIGGGREGNGGEIVITGGSVSAQAGTQAADIGSGNGGSGEGTLTNGEQNVYRTVIPDVVYDNTIISLRSADHPMYAYSGPGHGVSDLYFYLPQGASPETEQIFAIEISDAIVNGAIIVSTGYSTLIGEKYFAAYGESVTLKTMPDEGYRLDRYEVTTIPQGTGISVPSSGMFSMPDSDIYVYLTFKADSAMQYLLIGIAAAIIAIIIILVLRKIKKLQTERQEV